MKTSTILNVSDLNELKSLGSYHDVKRSIEEELDNKLGIIGWQSFFNKIRTIKEIVSANKEHLSSLCEKGSFKESKNEISRLLKLKITARSWDDLKRKIKNIINAFCPKDFDPYEYYEKTKLIKFRNSSKLENINIEIPHESVSLENVLAKYKR